MVLRHTQSEENEGACVAQESKPRTSEDVKPRRCLPTIVYTLFLLMGLFALGATALSISNYMRSVEGVSGLFLEITDL